MSGLASHMPVLKRLFDILDIRSVLEFGMGLNSTPFFIKNCERVVSIEMQSREWFQRVTSKHRDNHFSPYLRLGSRAYRNNVDLNGKWDLVFVDGHGGSRWEVINDCFYKTSLIVAHDTQQKSYQWNKVVLPENWTWKDIKDYPVWTSIITSDLRIIQKYEN